MNGLGALMVRKGTGYYTGRATGLAKIFLENQGGGQFCCGY